MKLSRLACLILLLPANVRADEPTWSAEKRNHWAWKAPVRQAIPSVKNAKWVRNPIDAFILTKLDAAGLQPAPQASREQLIRRVTFDLIGLPPTPEEIDGFVNDKTPTAWEKVVDRLLASPHYGERWGRHWLDLARYAESNGYEFDEARPNAWRYRDYVITSFNRDKPYDRFVKEQLAGDEMELLPSPSERGAGAEGDGVQSLIATGFNLLGPDMTDASSQIQRRQNTLDDMTDTAGLVFLGMTIGCARCHNHKFEPINASDYFRLQAFFAPSEFRRDQTVADVTQKAAHAKSMKSYQSLTKETQTKLDALEGPYRQKMYQARLAKLSADDRLAHETPEEKRTGAQKEMVANTARRLVVTSKEITSAMTKDHQAEQTRLSQELKKHDAHKPAALPTAMTLQESGKAPKTFVLKRGELKNPGEEVEAGWPTILTPGLRSEPAAIKAPSMSTTGRRTALANWLASTDHPLTARVMVNRIWQHHFGRGIVATPNDFGVRGVAPTHPELLDWLALEFMAKDWSVKEMHRIMLLSASYQQGTSVDSATKKADPENHLFSRMNRMRLEGEIIRDSLLAVGGRLNLRQGGPSVFPPLPKEATTGGKEWKASPDAADHVRRSVYIFARRNLRFPFLEPFDLPDSNQSCPKRERSTTAPQALALLNASDVSVAAKALAARVEKEAATTDERITRAYRLTLGRAPTAIELRISREFLAESPLNEFCRALFNVNEFVYLD